MGNHIPKVACYAAASIHQKVTIAGKHRSIHPMEKVVSIAIDICEDICNLWISKQLIEIRVAQFHKDKSSQKGGF